jgi:hypothetical protein
MEGSNAVVKTWHPQRKISGSYSENNQSLILKGFNITEKYMKPDITHVRNRILTRDHSIERQTTQDNKHQFQ